MHPDTKRQLFQSLGQFLAVIVSYMIVFQDFSAFQKVGVLNALWQPFWQGCLAVLMVWGVSKIGPAGSPPDAGKK